MSGQGEKKDIKSWFLKFKKLELKKEHYFMLLLSGVLLFVIALPVKEEDSVTGDITTGEAGAYHTGSNAADVEMSGEETLFAAEQYVNQMEEELKQMLSGVKGVGTAQVMITLKYTEGAVVEKDRELQSGTTTEADSSGGTRTSSETARNEMTVYAQGDERPLVVKQSMPEIEGVLVVCSGGDSPILKTEITEAVCALFKVDAHKIRVMKMK